VLSENASGNTPNGNSFRLLQAAKRHGPISAALVGADSAFALQSAREAHQEGILDPILVGPPSDIQRIAAEIGWDISRVRILAASGEAACAAAAVGLASDGEVKGLLKGNIHTSALLTAILGRAAGLRTGRRLTHAFHMSMPSGKDLILSDAAINVAPDIETLVDIVRNAISLHASLFQGEPKAAIISCTEEITPSVPSSQIAAEVAKRCIDERILQANSICGPLALDIAVSLGSAAIKGIDHPVAGNADVLIMPNIETGNALFKSLVHFAGAVPAGLVLGAAVPIMLTSRADSPEARTASVCLACIAAAKVICTTA
jgi:phosphate acetyltransferase